MMCECASCKLTDEHSGFIIEDMEIVGSRWPARGFADWPKGEHIRRSGKDAVYAAHWKHCGAEAHEKREKFNYKMRLGGKFISAKDTANRGAYLVPVPDDDVWVPIFQWERETGENYLDRVAEMKAERERKAA